MYVEEKRQKLVTLSVVTFFLLAMHFRVSRVRSQPDLLLCFVAGDGPGSEFVSQFIAHYYCFFFISQKIITIYFVSIPNFL